LSPAIIIGLGWREKYWRSQLIDLEPNNHCTVSVNSGSSSFQMPKKFHDIHKKIRQTTCTCTIAELIQSDI